MAQGKDRTEEINRIIMEGLDESIEDKRETLKLLASEKIKKRERNKRKKSRRRKKKKSKKRLMNVFLT
ncbi:MAG: hypothetical protein ABEK36_06415 [Candidatus Aenigmatarchaeota archaeon]